MKAHRRVLDAAEARCRSHDCDIKDSCARYTSPVVKGSPLADFKGISSSSFYPCLYHLSEMVADIKEEPTKEIKPWPIHHF